MVDTNGTTTLGYDALYRQNAVTYPNGNTQSYTYDPMGNRLTKVNNGVTTSYTNDNADQMTAAGGVTYGYDNNGNQTSRGTDTFGYNTENRLTSTSLGGTSGTYAYNGDGLRTSRTIGATTTTFAWGNATGMPVILQDSAGNSYLYGLDLISVKNSQNKKFYYHTDGLGSTTALTSSTGAVQNTYQYDVFGAIRVQTGTQPNEFTFAGEQVDSSNLQYLRARYYDNATGRFLVRDQLPLLHRYPYVGNNPANYADPYGLCIVCDFVRDNVVAPVEHHVVEPVVDATSANLDRIGYLDLNFTGCIPLYEAVGPCGTVGLQWQIGSTEFHPYVGAGVGTGIGIALTWAPGQQIREGWACGAQVTGGGWSYNVGHPVTRNKEGWGFVEVGGGFGVGGSVTCFYVF